MERLEHRLPLDHRSLRETVVDALRQLIIDGDLAAGERLVEERLAERLGVSRNPVREAIRTLEPMGLVKVIPRRGAYVADLDLQDIRRMQEVRVTLDRWIVQAAAIRHEDEDIASFDDCISRGRAASEAGDLITAAEQHRSFHLAIEAATKNPYATIAMNPLRQRAELVFAMLVHHRGPVGWDAHEAIRDAIVRRDVDLATKLMVDHVDEVVDELASRVTPTDG